MTTSHKHERYGFIGLGNMGKPMAQNLSNWLSSQSHPALKIYNRTLSKLIPASSEIVHSNSLEDLVKDCEVIITSLSSDEAAKEVFEVLFQAAKQKSEDRKNKGEKGSLIFVETSTLYPTTSGDLERQASAIPNTYYLQAPVFGPPAVAKEAKLVFVLSGDNWAKKTVQDFLIPSMGRKFIDVGHDVERAAAFKLNGNFLILGIVELLAESMTLADKTGVGSELLLEFIKEFMPAPSFIGYGTKILNNKFSGKDTGFTVQGGLKDASHIRTLAQSVDAVVPIIDIAHRHLITSRANGGGNLDWSSLVAGPRLGGGLLPFTGLKATEQDNGFGSKIQTGRTPTLAQSGNKEEVEEGGGGDHQDPNQQKVGGIKIVKNF